MELEIVALARRMFNAYNERGGWKTFDGRPVPQWDELGDEIRRRWVAAAIEARPELAAGTAVLPDHWLAGVLPVWDPNRPAAPQPASTGTELAIDMSPSAALDTPPPGQFALSFGVRRTARDRFFASRDEAIDFAREHWCTDAYVIDHNRNHIDVYEWCESCGGPIWGDDDAETYVSDEDGIYLHTRCVSDEADEAELDQALAADHAGGDVAANAAAGAYTVEEVRSKLINYLAGTARYWATTDLSRPEFAKGIAETGEVLYRLEGLVFSILVMLDGGTLALPAFDLYPAPHPDDRAYHEKNGERWYDPNVAVNGCQLHDLWSMRGKTEPSGG